MPTPLARVAGPRGGTRDAYGSEDKKGKELICLSSTVGHARKTRWGQLTPDSCGVGASRFAGSFTERHELSKCARQHEQKTGGGAATTAPAGRRPTRVAAGLERPSRVGPRRVGRPRRAARIGGVFPFGADELLDTAVRDLPTADARVASATDRCGSQPASPPRDRSRPLNAQSGA